MTQRTDQPLWNRVVDYVMRKPLVGTKAGEWSARKAQYAVKLYKDKGGGYKGEKDPNNSLVKWTNQEWTTKSGKPSSVTGERYLPKKAIEALSEEEYKKTTALKRKSKRAGEQFSKQPLEIAQKVKEFRE